MSYLVFPEDQNIILDYHHQKSFKNDPIYGTKSAHIVTSRLLNKLLYPYGNNCIVKGLTSRVSIHNITSTTQELIARIYMGIMIIDSTLVEVKAAVTLTLDFVNSTMLDTGYFILLAEYSYPTTVSTNNIVFKLRWISSDGNTILPNDVDTDVKQYIVLNVYDFNVTNSKIVKIKNAYGYPDFYQIEIQNNTFDIAPMSRITKKLILSPSYVPDYFTIDSADITAGYVTLSSIPRLPAVVRAKCERGIYMLNQLAATASNITEKADFTIVGNKFIIRNGTYLDSDDPEVLTETTVTNLTDEISVSDHIVVEYVY